MEALRYVFLLLCVYQADGRKTYADMFSHKHAKVGKLPFPIPPIPGWSPDSNPWDDYLYPPLSSRPNKLKHHSSTPTVHLTSDSPALKGSHLYFTAKLEFPPCQKEDANGDLVWDEHCEDANGQVRSGYVYNRSSWIDDYGFGECKDTTKCNVFPDGKPFPQSSDWRRKSYVYVFRTMDQYYEIYAGSSCSLTINTTVFSLGSEVMEVMVYRISDRRKYSPLTTDFTIFFITDKIPMAVYIFQKAALNQSENVFFRGDDVDFKVMLHDPSNYLKTAAYIDYMWDFRDGNQLVTHRDMITHTYNKVGNLTVKLVVEAAFPIECPPTTAPPPQRSSTKAPLPESTTSPTHAGTIGMDTTPDPLPSTTAEPTPTALAWLRARRLSGNRCYRYVYGPFSANISIIEPKHGLHSRLSSRILGVTADRVTNTDISFLVKCLGNIPTSACTIVSDHTCTQVSSIMCDDVPPSSVCEVHLRRTFPEPGTYCVNITLEDSRSLTLTSTTVTINKSQDAPVSKSSHTAAVVLSSAAVLVAVFAFIAYLTCKRYKVYRPIRRSLVEDACSPAGVGGHMVRLKESLFPSNEESHHLLTERRPM